MKKEAEKLHNEYRKKVDSIDAIKLCIVGQDVYPENNGTGGYEGIAFYKKSFNELFKSNCSGKTVLESLGYTKDSVEKKFETSKDFFFHLLENEKVAFINVAYHLLKEKGNNIDEYIIYNEAFLKKSEKIVLLGTGKTRKLFKKHYKKFYDNPTTKAILHPAYRIKNKKWKCFWETNYLKKFVE